MGSLPRNADAKGSAQFLVEPNSKRFFGVTKLIKGKPTGKASVAFEFATSRRTSR